VNQQSWAHVWPLDQLLIVGCDGICAVQGKPKHASQHCLHFFLPRGVHACKFSTPHTCCGCLLGQTNNWEPCNMELPSFEAKTTTACVQTQHASHMRVLLLPSCGAQLETRPVGASSPKTNKLWLDAPDPLPHPPHMPALPGEPGTQTPPTRRGCTRLGPPVVQEYAVLVERVMETVS
jgi:hypothetical protein